MIASALAFAHNRHAGHYRKDGARTPYIVHPIEVMTSLVHAGEVDEAILSAALLHDVLEDTPTSQTELSFVFGLDVLRLVVELTDDKRLEKPERKAAQLAAAPHYTIGAAKIRIADKIANVADLVHRPPVKWSGRVRNEYAAWALKVVQACPFVEETAALRREFETVYRRAQ
jgi:guanosine-3',5'-bis(diphosphate) 3'-pyrophosphohydrolase